MGPTSDALNKVRNTGVYQRAINLAFTARKTVEELGGEVSWYIQQAMYRVKQTMWALDTRMNPTNVRIYSNGTIAGDLPDGRTINLHPSTTLNDTPSLEIYNPATGTSIKIRY